MGPLNKSDIMAASKALFELTVNQDRIDKLEQAKQDVAELRARNEHAMGSLKAIINAYGPAQG